MRKDNNQRNANSSDFPDFMIRNQNYAIRHPDGSIHPNYSEFSNLVHFNSSQYIPTKQDLMKNKGKNPMKAS